MVVTQSNTTPTTQADESWKKWLAAGAAVLLLVLYLGLVWRAWGSTGDVAEMWARKVYLMGGIEALAFAAAGWLFGKEVSRQAVETLKEDADKANAAADEAKGQERARTQELDAARSQATSMATAFKAYAPSSEASAEQGVAFEGRGATGHLESLLRQADEVLEAFGKPARG